MIRNKKKYWCKTIFVFFLLVLILTGCGSSAKTDTHTEGDRQDTALSTGTSSTGISSTGISSTGISSGREKADPGAGTSTYEKKTTPESGTASTGTEEKSRLQVVTTIFPQYDFARHIAGDRADVTMLLKPGEEVHSYEPTPQDIKKIQNCDLFIYVGGENDVWVENILDSVKGDQDGPQTVRLLALVETYAEEHLEGMMEEKGRKHVHEHESEDSTEEEHDHEHKSEDSTEEEHDHEHESEDSTEEEHDHEHESEDSAEEEHVYEHELDEHVWTSPENCVILIEKLTQTFCSADPSNAEIYRKNGDAYRTEFEKLDAQYRTMAASASRKTILFGDRFPFRYLAEELGLTCYAAFPGCSSESEPSAATIAFLIDKAAEERLPVVFQIEFSNGNIARAISEAAELKIKKKSGGQAEKATGGGNDSGHSEASEPEGEEMTIQVLQLHSCHNLTADDFRSGETCLSLMTRNLEALRIALGAASE